MANETDKKLFGEICSVYDRAALTLTDTANELLELEIKFGSGSSLVKKRKEQLQDLRRLYDGTLSYINYLRELNNNMYIEFWAKELFRHQRETGLPVSKIMDLAGQGSEQWKKIDELDDLINLVREKVGPAAEVNNEFEDFINALREGSPSSK
jgi:hypothetical protein